MTSVDIDRAALEYAVTVIETNFVWVADDDVQQPTRSSERRREVAEIVAGTVVHAYASALLGVGEAPLPSLARICDEVELALNAATSLGEGWRVAASEVDLDDEPDGLVIATIETESGGGPVVHVSGVDQAEYEGCTEADAALIAAAPGWLRTFVGLSRQVIASAKDLSS